VGCWDAAGARLVLIGVMRRHPAGVRIRIRGFGIQENVLCDLPAMQIFMGDEN